MPKLKNILLGLGFSLGLAAGCTAIPDDDTATSAVTSYDCTLTQGYWKNHESAWPVASLQLGTVTYTKAQALAILRQPVQGNGLISLAHQLIAAKLNVAAGASAGSISGAITQADTLIGSLVVPPVGTGTLRTSATSSLVGALDGYNTGATGPGHCDDGPPTTTPPACGDGAVNQASEQCDDGNTTSNDGCSSTCQIEEEPPCGCCGNGVVEAGEACDDGNSVSGDGCSSTCQVDQVDECVCPLGRSS